MGRRVKALRRAGFLPAVIYGEGIASQAVSIPYKEFEKVWKEAGESTLVKLLLGEDESRGKEYTVLIHDIKNDPLRGQALHADFYAVRMDKKIKVKVPLIFVGESPAVKNESGILVKVTQELEVEALPKDLPHEIRAELSLLDAINSRIQVKDLDLPKSARIDADPAEIIAIIEAPRTEEEVKEISAVSEPAVAEVKTEREIKKEMKKETSEEMKEGGVAEKPKKQ